MGIEGTASEVCFLSVEGEAGCDMVGLTGSSLGWELVFARVYWDCSFCPGQANSRTLFIVKSAKYRYNRQSRCGAVFE
jgi:hypothetical protein